jgi:hypothetical protein
MFGMRRRDFITLLGGAAAWPLAARAQRRSHLSGLIIESASGRFAEIGRSEQSYTDADARSAHTQSDTFAATTRS